MINPFQVVARVGAEFLNLWQATEWVDPTESMDPDYEPLAGEVEFIQTLASHMPEGVWHRYSVELLKAPNGDVFCDDAALLPTDSSHAAPPVCDEGPDGVVRRSPASAVGAPKLPMFNAANLIDIAAEYVAGHKFVVAPELYGCECGEQMTRYEHALHVGELVVSALTDELTALAYDQSHQTPQ